jgi:catechol 2,3-dioxygenase-like lactoylglutathione lyase family enzyme
LQLRNAARYPAVRGKWRAEKMIRGLKFVSIPVRDQDASLKFFTEKLGFKVATDQFFNEKQRWIELLIPGAETGLVLFTPEGHENRVGDFQPLSFWCDDVFATAKTMKSKSRRKRAGEPQLFSKTSTETSSFYPASNERQAA